MFTPIPSIRIAELLAQGDALDSLPRDGVLEKDPEKIKETLGALIRHGTQAELVQGDKRVRIRPLFYSPELDILQWEVGNERLAAEPCTITLLGYNALFRFKVAQVLQHGSKLTTPAPVEIFKIRQRWQRRQDVDDLLVSCELPGGTTIRRRVRDISYGGLAMFHKEEEGHLLLEGETILASLVNGSGDMVKIQARVVEISTSNAGDICHLRINSLRGRQDGWVDLVNDRLHPGTKVGSEYSQEVWDLYTECGYFNLSGKSPEDFERMQRGYYGVVSHLDGSPQLGCQVVWPNPQGEAGVNAALSMLKVYSHSWFGFQMARVSGETKDGVSGRKVLREIHLRAYEHAQQDPELRWLIAYPQVKKVWSRMLHHDLPARYVKSKEASIVRFRAMQYDVNSLSRSNKEEVTVDRPSADELHALAIHIGKTRSKVYCEALDLVPERMAMADVRKLFARTHLTRDRMVLVVRHQGKAMAAAVAEMASDGLHVFGLLDLVRIYPLDDRAEDHYADLLAGCATWFKSKAKETFCLYLEDGQKLDEITFAAATDMGEADMVILSAERLPEFFEFLHEITSPRTNKLEISEPHPQ